MINISVLYLISQWKFLNVLFNLFQNLHSQGPMCRALCAVEMLSLQNNGLPEFTGTCPTLPEVSLFDITGSLCIKTKCVCDKEKQI